MADDLKNVYLETKTRGKKILPVGSLRRVKDEASPLRHSFSESSKQGFSLVEVLLVIVIIGILAATLFMSLGKQRERSRISAFKENMRDMISIYTACTDGDNVIIGDSALADGSDNVACQTREEIDASGYDLLPAMRDCDGNDSNSEIEVAIIVDRGVFWYFQGRCNVTGGNTCYANCDAKGCVFCNTIMDQTSTPGTWDSACDSNTHCD